MICPTCHSEVSDASKFCENCGAPLPQLAEQPAQPIEVTPAAHESAQPEPAQVQPAQGAQDAQAFGGASVGQSGEQPYQAASQQPYTADSQPSYGAAAGAGAGVGAGGAPVNPGASPYGQTQQAPPAPGAVPSQQGGSSTPFVLAIIGLVCVFLGLFPVSIVLAIIALVMNSNQKKEGIFTTKQTPTTVISVIGLIMAGIELIMVMLLGGAMFAVIQSEEFQKELQSSHSSSASVTVATSSSAASSAAAAASGSSAVPAASAAAVASAAAAAATEAPVVTDLVGTWTLAEAVLDGQTYDPDYVQLLRKNGLEITFDIRSDGSGTLNLQGNVMSGIWEGSMDNFSFSVQGDRLTGRVVNNQLKIEDGESSLTFQKKA